MCDTIYAGPAACASGSHGGALAWFAKNSDRHPREAQALCLLPRREPAASLKLGGRSLDLPDRGYAFALSKPAWMAGGEMGLNEKGVAIGNEAVFSRFKAKKDGILGMDILRAALAQASTPEEARDFIIAVTEREEQGGNGAFKGNLVYSNSYLIAGAGEGFILETAGKRWAWRSTKAIATISNAYSIEEDFKRLDTQTRKEISPVNERAACSDEADPGRKGQKESWRGHVEDRFYLGFTKGDQRRARTAAGLQAALPTLGMDAVLAALRDHGPGGDAAAGRAGMEAPCLHEAGFPVKSSTTASLAVEFLPPGGGAEAILWFTGSSYPCLSVFAPLILAGGEFLPLWTSYDYAEGAESSYRLWEIRRSLARRSGGPARLADPAFIGMRDGIQARLRALAREAAAQATGGGLEAARRGVNEAMLAWEGYLEKSAR
jgi:dipeptidase